MFLLFLGDEDAFVRLIFNQKRRDKFFFFRERRERRKERDTRRVFMWSLREKNNREKREEFCRQNTTHIFYTPLWYNKSFVNSVTEFSQFSSLISVAKPFPTQKSTIRSSKEEQRPPPQKGEARKGTKERSLFL